MFTRLRRKSAVLLLVVLLVVAGTPFAAPSPAFADLPTGDIPWRGYPDQDIVLGGVWTREALAANLGQFRLYGANENFAWYSQEATLTVRIEDTRQWASRAMWNAGSVKWNGRYFTGLNYLFTSGSFLHMWWTGENSYINKASGAHGKVILNPVPPKISGYKWHDTDGDGVREAGEPVLAGAAVEIRRGAVLLGSVTTNASGYWEYVVDATLGRTPGQYTATSPAQPGWGTSRTGSCTVAAGVPAVTYGGNDVGVFVGGSISGNVWVDRDADTVRDADEVGARMTVRLKRAGADTITVESDAEGRYTCGGLAIGTYIVDQEPPAGWRQTAPAAPGYYTCEVSAGTNIVDRDFGNVQLGGIRPLAVHDIDADGAWEQPGEPLLSGWTVRAASVSGAELAPLVTSAEVGTAPWWKPLGPGTYRVWTDAAGQEGYQPTGPTERMVELAAGQEVDVTFLNVQTGTISGTVFHDLDGSHAANGAEPGIPEWNVTLTYPDGHAETKATAADGTYAFAGLVPGPYEVTQESRDGWLQTTGASEHVSLSAGQLVTVSFGDLLTGGVSGASVNDLDGDGAVDAGEAPVAGATVMLAMADGTPVGTPVAVDADGAYAFSGLVPGVYDVVLAERAGWRCTCDRATVTVTGGGTATAVPLLSVEYGSISGREFCDGDADGTLDEGEAGLPGRQVTLEKLDAGAWAPVGMVSTQPDGTYTFGGLLPGTYRLAGESRAHWRRTLAPAGEIELRGGDRVTGKDFAAIELASLDLRQWDDANADGVWDAGEGGKPGWAIKVTGRTVAGEDVSYDLTTDAEGKALLADVLPGTYEVAVGEVALALNPDGSVAEPGWRSTTPTTASVALAQGVAESRTFGAIHLGWISGRVVHEVYGTPAAGIRMELAETGEATYTNADGDYYFYSVEPNGTRACPTLDYLVGMDLTGSMYRTEAAVDRSVTVGRGGSAVAGFGVHEDTWGSQPKTVNYWRAWDKYHTAAEMDGFVQKVRLGSDEFANITAADVYRIIQIDKSTTVEGKARAQYLAFWLNVASGKLGFSTLVDVSATANWQTVVTSADSAGQTDIIGLLGDMERAFVADLTRTVADIVKGILERINGGSLGAGPATAASRKT